MLSRAWSYWNAPAEQSSKDNNNNNNDTSSLSNIDPKEKEREEMKNVEGGMGNMTTTIATNGMDHSNGNGYHTQSLSTPLLTNNNNNKGGVMVEEEKTRDSRSSLAPSSSSSHHYTFNPIQYHYTKVCKSRSATTTIMMISHSTPMSLPLDQLHATNNNSNNKSSPRQQSERKVIMNSEKNTDGDDNNDDSSVMVGISAVSISSNNNSSYNNGEHGIITRYLDSMPVTSDEREALFELHKWIGNDTLSNKMKEELCLGDMIMSYYSSFSRSNPDAKGCWKRWVGYLDDSPLKDVNFNRVKEFFATGLYNVAYDRQNRPVFIINTKYYDDSFGPEITAKATILFITSLLWNIRTNEFDFNALRKGVCVYADLSHYSINMLAWNIIQACKSALVAFPFQLIDIYCVNTPTFVYMLRQIASKIIVPHAMEKIKVLGNPDEYFEKYGIKSKTPVENGGTWKISTTQWMKERGFIESEDKN